ncbi:30S ribosomal protein S16 [Candidatus Campbellbacteria bacterium CG10_big_fil_rev_8_21_14_0_10_35_52]|uniref:30S ribosomal protein S16 n=1 Tax=Candidatus Campbellbacteria bacterium CG10_big_fil_rev_8_21_14_0_10_35_52 TaxID=1974527 RepID=A0A2M6WVC5_9BACT|nr:MAG: 30S ribosomal protein S16 [Candidatus Campbellbacteria bacterium CG10_big_fil_rev_8_21_14_0_10_35_52]
MLKIRLQRIGRKNDPSFRVVCVDSKKGPKSNNNVEILGSYDPKRNYIAINDERTLKRISNGALVSDTVHNLLIKRGIIKGKKINVSKNKKNAKNAELVKEETSVKEIPVEIKSEEMPADDKKEDIKDIQEKPPKEELVELSK